MIVIASKPGQLGNLLLVFAHFVAYAIEKGGTILDPAIAEYAGFFRSLDGRPVPVFPAGGPRFRDAHRLGPATYQVASLTARALGRLRLRMAGPAVVALDWGERLDLGSPEFAALARRRLLFARGWEFRYPAAFARHADAIRTFFAPRAEVVARVEAVAMAARSDCEVLVGVHVRHGDYRTFEGGRYFYPLTEYRRAMDATLELFGGRRVGFLICSDQAQDPGSWAGLRWTTGTGQAVEDLYALARCDYLLGPPSTFSLWASFYGNVPLHLMSEPGLMPSFRGASEYW